jgi:tRNA(Ile2) C34 agmatinyltransferase TiaS
LRIVPDFQDQIACLKFSDKIKKSDEKMSIIYQTKQSFDNESIKGMRSRFTLMKKANKLEFESRHSLKH